MNSTIKSRVKRVIEELGVESIPRIYCTMQDGTKNTWRGLDVIGPFLDGQIKQVKTDDPDIAALLTSFHVPGTTVDVI